MDWQQKAEALAGLAELKIVFRERQWRIGSRHPWYVSQSIEIKEESTLCGAHGEGDTPETAINDQWRLYVDDLNPRHCIRVGQGELIRYVRWGGCLWTDVQPPRLRDAPAPPPIQTERTT